ncbi:MAG: cbb3-type cytochrome c oxidase subunit I [Planctomycetota bacterium]
MGQHTRELSNGTFTYELDSPNDSYLVHFKGIKSWLLTLDHKRIAINYLVCISIALLLGGIYALLLRLDLWNGGLTATGEVDPNQSKLLTNDQYNHAFTVHGAVMTFLVLIPGIPAILGNFALPLMLGAKDVAFPRLNLLSWYLWVSGLICFLYTLFMGGLDTGWTFYTPYSVTTNTSVISALFGAFMLGFSSILTGLNFIVTIHKMRPAGMGWFEMPLFLWSLYATGIIQLLATPVLGITLLMLIVERSFGLGIFDPAYGGDPVLFQHFFWFYSHPAVYVMVLPAMGVISELISTFSRKPVFGYKMIAMSSVAIAFLGFLVWGHHMFTSGQSPLMGTIFSFITFSIAIPSAIKVFNWLTTMYKGSVALNTPMIYALSFLGLFGIGGLTGLFLSTMATDIMLHDTYFVVAHFHYVMVGGTIIALLGGLHYWWPKMFGKSYNSLVAKTGGILVFIGFNVTFFPQFVMGSRGMPRRYHMYLEQFQSFHQWSTIGAFILGLGMFMAAGNFIWSLLRGPKAPVNPWGASTLDWKTATPPYYHNFDVEPEVRPGDIYHYDRIVPNPEGPGFVEKKRDAMPAETGAKH